MIKLDYLTIGVVILIVAIISTQVMLILWRINKNEKGLKTCALASVAAALGFLALLFYPILGSYAIFFNNVGSLATPLLILEGILQFREYGGVAFRKRALKVVFIFIVIISFVNKNNLVMRYIFHDATIAPLFLLNAYFIIHGVKGKERRVCNIIVFSFTLISIGFIYRFYLAVNGTIILYTGQTHPYNNVLFLLGILWSLGWTFGLTLLTNFRAQQNMLKMATRDGLTGLSNRMKLNETLMRLLDQICFTKEKFIVFMLDLNGFKKINDIYGHPFGDQVLITMSKALGEVVREHDHSARLGGDEFICIMGVKDPKRDISQIKHRLREAVEKVRVVDQLQVVLRASIGYAIIPDDGSTVDQILAVADKSMYLEKVGTRQMSEVIGSGDLK